LIFSKEDLTLLSKLESGLRVLDLKFSRLQKKIVKYIKLIEKWNSVYNLTAVREKNQMLAYHVMDSLAVCYAFKNSINVLDVGSGAGLPGILIAIWGLDINPSMVVHLVDSSQKRSAFLNQVKIELNLKNVKIYNQRVENLNMYCYFDKVICRAFANLSEIISKTKKLISLNGQILAMKANILDKELTGIPFNWQIISRKNLVVPGLLSKRQLIILKNFDSSN